jgi:hypothetical protein
MIMARKITTVFALLLATYGISQNKDIPQWFLDDLEANIGTWITDNAAYISENEPMTQYAVEWTWGIGKTSMEGRLFGYIKGEKTGDFWHFRQYWDNLKSEAVLVQFGGGGTQGVGPLNPLADGTMEVVQVFSLPDGRSWKTRHLSSFEGSDLRTTSFDLVDEAWVERRTYIWKKQLKE